MTRISDMTPITPLPASGANVPMVEPGLGINYLYDITLLGRGINVKDYGAKGNSNAAGTVGADDTTAIQAGINYLNGIGGGTLYFPEGYYKISGPIQLYANISLKGAGRHASIIVATHAGTGTGQAGVQSGSAFYTAYPINGSTAANNLVEDLGIICTNAGNIGVAYYDQGGAFVRLNRFRFTGFKYGVIFDQTEVSSATAGEASGCLAAGFWLVNGPDLNGSAIAGFTNQIVISDCQINNGAAAYGVIDDGGNGHAYNDNNFNGCLNHIRVAGVTGLKISGGEYEGANSTPIVFTYTGLSGGGVGQCSAVWLGGGAEIIPVAGQSCVNALSLSDIVINGVFFGNTAAAKFIGAVNTNHIISLNAANGGGGATFDGRATNHFEVGNNGTNFRIRTNLAYEVAGNVAIDASRNATLTSVALGGGTPLTGAVVYSQSITPASVNAATAAEQTFTITGLTTADKVIINPAPTGNSTALGAARVSAANTLAIQFINPTAGALTPGSGTYTILALRS